MKKNIFYYVGITAIAIGVFSIFIYVSAFSGPSCNPPGCDGSLTSDSSGNIGIKTSPNSSFALNVNGDSKITGDLTTTGNITANKLTAGTVDPIYEINGEKYATYVSETFGVRVDFYGKIKIENFNGEEYSKTLDLKNAEEGSNLWLFWQTINEGKNMEDVLIFLTPEKPATVWYEINSAEKTITLKSSKASTVSYHLSAPRVDSDDWDTKISKSDPSTGAILKEK